MDKLKNKEQEIIAIFKEIVENWRSEDFADKGYWINVAKSLSNVRRLSLVYCLSLAEMNIKEMEYVTGFTQPALAIYLGRLRLAGLVQVRKNRINYYSLKSARVVDFMKYIRQYDNIAGINDLESLITTEISRDVMLENLKEMHQNVGNNAIFVANARLYGLLSNFDRAMILFMLYYHKLNVGQLHHALGRSQPAVSQNLNRLQQARLISSVQKKQSVIYSVESIMIKRLFEYLTVTVRWFIEVNNKINEIE